MVVICNAEPWRAISDYLQRWQIETMFLAVKGQGFNLEDTHLKDRDTISKLLCTLALAFCWAYKAGEWINECTDGFECRTHVILIAEPNLPDPLCE